MPPHVPPVSGHRSVSALEQQWHCANVTNIGAEPTWRYLAVSGVAVFETDTEECCRSLGMAPADLFRPVSLVEIRPGRAKSSPLRLSLRW
jgi:hypothetical protein